MIGLWQTWFHKSTDAVGLIPSKGVVELVDAQEVTLRLPCDSTQSLEEVANGVDTVLKAQQDLQGTKDVLAQLQGSCSPLNCL
jgi:hypothetical protein